MYHNAKSVRFGRETLHLMMYSHSFTMYHNAKSVRFGRETLHMMYSHRCITMLKVFDLEGKPYI